MKTSTDNSRRSLVKPHPESRTSNHYYRFHRLALFSLLAIDPIKAFETVKNQITETEQQPFLEFILQNGLGPLWGDLLQKNNILSFFSPQFMRELRNITSYAASLHLFQKIALNKAHNLFSENEIPYAAFKGVHTRELLYAAPALRYACDIDLLVSRTDRVKALKTLVQAGFALQPNPEIISHEATLSNDRVSIDLHWDILRPGRTRIDLTDEFLATGKEYSDYRALNNEASLFIMLVHPVFTKYTTTPQASLLHLIDLHNWIKTQKTDWDKLYDYLDRGGVKTAAWITATWLALLTGESLPESFLQKIKPSALKARYLRIWLDKNLSTRLLNLPFLIQAGFTLPAHDRLTDTVRFLRQVAREKKNAAAEIQYLLKQIPD